MFLIVLFLLYTVQGDLATCDQKKLAFNVTWYLRSSICYNEVFSTPVSIR